MPENASDDRFWDYVARWKTTFQGQERRLRWERNWLENDYCADCRFCCGPQDSATPFPMSLLPGQIRPGLDKDFYLLDGATAYLGKDGCRSDTPHGCRLTEAQKPVACGLFPIVLVNGGLWLYQTCPAVIFTPLIRFLELAKDVEAFLSAFSLPDLRHISIWLNDDVLAAKYINLHLPIFKPGA